MTTAIRRHPVVGLWVLTALAVGMIAPSARAIPLDDRGDIKFGLRAYTSVRIGTEKIGGEDNPLNYPSSAAGHVRQHRYFLQLDFDHDLSRIAQTSWGPARLFGLLDQGFDSLGWHGRSEIRYTVQYRGEGEGIYDYGPSEYSDGASKLRAYRAPVPSIS